MLLNPILYDWMTSETYNIRSFWMCLLWSVLSDKYLQARNCHLLYFYLKQQTHTVLQWIYVQDLCSLGKNAGISSLSKCVVDGILLEYW